MNAFLYLAAAAPRRSISAPATCWSGTRSDGWRPLWRYRAPSIREQLLAILEFMRLDNRKAWILQPDGSYVRPEPEGSFISQAALQTGRAARMSTQECCLTKAVEMLMVMTASTIKCFHQTGMSFCFQKTEPMPTE